MDAESGKWRDGFLSLEETTQVSVSHTDRVWMFDHLTSVDINFKYIIISHRKFNI